MSLIVKSAVKKLVKGKESRISAESFDKLESIVATSIDGAIKRAKQNGRKTIQAHDI